MLLLNGKPISPDAAFTHADIQYPANWLRHASAEEKAAIGISEVVEQPRPDERFFWVTDNGNGTFSVQPKDLAAKKSEMVRGIKEVAGQILSGTDWKIVRRAENGSPVDVEALVHRDSVRVACNKFEADINACLDIPALSALSFNWPQSNAL